MLFTGKRRRPRPLDEDGLIVGVRPARQRRSDRCEGLRAQRSKLEVGSERDGQRDARFRRASGGGQRVLRCAGRGAWRAWTAYPKRVRRGDAARRGRGGGGGHGAGQPLGGSDAFSDARRYSLVILVRVVSHPSSRRG